MPQVKAVNGTHECVSKYVYMKGKLFKRIYIIHQEMYFPFLNEIFSTIEKKVKVLLILISFIRVVVKKYKDSEQ